MTGRAFRTLAAIIATLGTEGWEVCHVATLDHTGTALLKRPLSGGEIDL